MRVQVVVRSTDPLNIQVLVSVPPYNNTCPWECWRGEWWMDEPSSEEMRVTVTWGVWIEMSYDFWLWGVLNEG